MPNPIIRICNVLNQQLLNRNTERDDGYDTPHLGLVPMATQS